tara:strand:+ start:1 stop:774 length:774 start_codon:yes stop_codon:yes gene_type:complete
MYSFSRSEEEFKEFYELCAKTYERIFARVGIGEVTYRTVADGGSFTTEFTDEFQTLSEAGEDTIYVDKKKNIAINKEVYTDEVISELGLKKEDLVEEKAIEVGNIFPLGLRFSKALGLTYKDEEGKEQEIVMGSYGIGLGRLMGVVVEVFSDDKGIVWPKEIAPFSVHLVALPGGEKEADKVYEELGKQDIEVLYDDREQVSAGGKLVDADLFGIPQRIVVSKKTVEQGAVELKKRNEEQVELVQQKDLRKALLKNA